MRTCSLILFICFLSACQFIPKSNNKAKVEKISTSKSIINTVPLMTPAVQSLHSQALEHYQAGELEKAQSILKRANQIQANAPQVMMLIAEISLKQGDYDQSYYWSKLATKNGPSVGPICEKSWQILALAAEFLQETETQFDALERKENCLVKRQNRY